MGDNDVKVLYVLGVYRSGTTVLSNLIGQQEGFFTGGEINASWREFANDEGRCGCGAPLLQCEVWSKVLAAAFGPFTVRWTCRSKAVNRRVGGARRSYHLTGNAVDFNMPGNFRAVLSFLKANKRVGGLKHYGGGAFHIDTGPRRTW